MSRTESGITTFPVNKSFSPDEKELPELKYDFHLLNNPDNEKIKVFINVAPTHNFRGEGLYFAVAIDDEEPQVIDIHKDNIIRDWKYPGWFNMAVGNYSIKIESEHILKNKGNHTLKLYMISSGVIFQKIVIDNGGLEKSYLGPPESTYIK